MPIVNSIQIYKEKIKIIIYSIITKDVGLYYRAQSGNPAKFEDVMRVIDEYGGITIREIPDEGFSLARIYKNDDGSERIDFPLWTEEEGLSDLYIYFIGSHDDDNVEIRTWDIYVP